MPPTPSPAHASNKPVRRTYVLSNDLVDRVQQFAASQGLNEVEAARKLLIQSLNTRESGQSLEARLLSLVGKRRSILNEVFGHPNVINIDLSTNHPLIQCRDGHEFRLLSEQGAT